MQSSNQNGGQKKKSEKHYFYLRKVNLTSTLNTRKTWYINLVKLNANK